MTNPKCAICGRPPIDRFTPFCSLRCAEVDLGRWFGEAYRIPDTSTDPDEAPDAASEHDDFTG